MKANVDSMHLIQVGLTFSDRHGNLPTFGTSNRFIWEFNFCEFDVTRHPHAPHSIALLRRQDIDFDKNRRFGVNIVRFAELMMLSGLLCNNNIQWIVFHSAYDLGYMVKILSQRFFFICNHFYLPTCVTFFNSLNYSLNTKYTTLSISSDFVPTFMAVLTRFMSPLVWIIVAEEVIMLVPIA